MIFIKDEETAKHIPNLVPKLNTDNSYVCTTFQFPIEIFRTDAEKSNLTFKCLNSKKIKPKKQSKLVNIYYSMRKYIYLFSESSLYHTNKANLKILKFFLNSSNVIQLFSPIIY